MTTPEHSSMSIDLGRAGSPALAVVGIGELATGDVGRPLSDADAVLMQDGRIVLVGSETEVMGRGPDSVVDANGLTVVPGLIDPHVHLDFNDFNPGFRKIGWMEDCFRGGVTTMIDQGCVGCMKGRPLTAEATRAIALVHRQANARHRPGGGLKVHGGAVVLTRGLNEEDFRDLRSDGVFVVAEIGGGGLYRMDDIAEMLGWAREHGFVICHHFGPAAIVGGASQGAAEIIATMPDVVVHANGGPVAPPLDDVERVIARTNAAIEIVFNGNQKRAVDIVGMLLERGEPGRLILGTDGPVGLGTQTPFGILRIAALASSLGGLPPELAVAAGTGNTARRYGLNVGTIAPGCEADLLVIDRPFGSDAAGGLEAIAAGEVPAVALTIVDGEIVRQGFFPYTDRRPAVDGAVHKPRTLEEFRAGRYEGGPAELDGSAAGTALEPFGAPNYD